MLNFLKVKVIVLGLLAALIFVPQVKAQVNGRNFGQIYTECGIGAMLFQHQKWAGWAAVSNVIWDLGTTASSSALTTPESCMGGKIDQMAAFIYHSYDSLENDLAKGYGEHLETLLGLAGKNQSDVESLRNQLSVLVADQSYTNKTRYQKAEALFNIVNQNNEVIS